MRDERERALDAWLAAAARTGDRQALGKLAGRWHEKLLRHAWRLTGDTDLAADATQEAWTDMLRGLHRLTDTGLQSSSSNGPTGSLGLGLYIAERIVSAHCGKNEVKSSEAQVTTFSVCLPRVAPPRT